jgi:DegV family protein with EDD domain
MRILSNPGVNLSAETLAHYQIALSSQQIVVDGVRHDPLTEEISLAQVDAWVAKAREHPHTLGTSAAEFATTFRRISDEDPEILVLVTSRKVVGSYAAAVAAAKQLAEHPRHRHVRIRVVDGRVADIGVGLVVALAGEARRAGLSLDAVADLAEAAAERIRLCLFVAKLDNLVKGGRASFLRAWFANVLQVRPLLTFRDGELVAAAKVRATDDPSEVIAKFLEEAIGPANGVWVGVAHGDAALAATLTAKALRRRFEPVFSCVKPLSPSVYLHVGPGGVAAYVLPLDGLPWQPSAPPHFT